MNSIAKILLSKRKQHDVGRRSCRRRGNDHRRELEDDDVAGEVDVGGLERALFTQEAGEMRGAAKFLTLSVASFILSSLLAHRLLSECRSMRRFDRAPYIRESERYGRKWPSVGKGEIALQVWEQNLSTWPTSARPCRT